MPHGDKAFLGTIPEVYDSYLVPLIFESYAEDLAARVSADQPTKILEIAAGSGVVARALAPRLAPGTDYMVTDLNEPMLEQAAKRQPNGGSISYRVADALELPFADGTFDTVLCQFAAMFFPDRVRGYSEARRTLKPGGQFIFNVWDKLEANQFPFEVERALETVFPSDPPRFMSRMPYSYFDPEQIRRELAVAGFSEISIEPREDTSTAPNARYAATAFCKGTPLLNEINIRDPFLLDRCVSTAARAIAERFGAGEVSGDIRGFVITATA